MKCGVIIGSHRNMSQSSKVGNFIEFQIKNAFPQSETFTLDLKNNPIPLWSEDKWADEETEIIKTWRPISNQLRLCDSFVIITPEWSGMATPAIKNFFLMCDKGELSHKPALIVSVSSGRGGRYPIAELRMSSYKNTRIVYIPDHIIVDHVNDVINNNLLNETDKNDYRIKNRILYSLGVLDEYAKAFYSIRQSKAIDTKNFPHGM